MSTSLPVPLPTFGWYGHLKDLSSRPLWIVALCLMGGVAFIFRS